MIIDTGHHLEGIGKALSNLCPYAFTLDDVRCGSMEGFLQSLKVNGQTDVIAMSGMEAYRAGQAGNDWKLTQTLWWKGERYSRISKKYHALLDRAYDACMTENPEFREALIASGNSVLAHDIGKHNPANTTLTAWEYLYQLYRLRSYAQQD